MHVACYWPCFAGVADGKAPDAGLRTNVEELRAHSCYKRRPEQSSKHGRLATPRLAHRPRLLLQCLLLLHGLLAGIGWEARDRKGNGDDCKNCAKHAVCFADSLDIVSAEKERATKKHAANRAEGVEALREVECASTRASLLPLRQQYNPGVGAALEKGKAKCKKVSVYTLVAAATAAAAVVVVVLFNVSAAIEPKRQDRPQSTHQCLHIGERS